MMLTSPHEEIVMKGNSFPIFLRSEWLITAWYWCFDSIMCWV
jgi:hypothetical protein